MAIIDYWNLPEDQKRGMDILIREGAYPPPPPPPQPRGPGVQVFQPQGGSIPLPRNWDWTAMESEYPPPLPLQPRGSGVQAFQPQGGSIPLPRYSDYSHEDGLSSKYLRRTPSNPRPITPPKPYGVLWPQHLEYRPPALSRLSPELIAHRIPNVYDAFYRQAGSAAQTRQSYGGQAPSVPKPMSSSRTQATAVPQPVPSPSPVVPRERAIVLYNPSQQAANATQTSQAYAAGMDDYFPGLKPPDFPKVSKGFTAGGRINPGTIAHSLTNLGPVDALFSLGSAPFTYATYKSFGATDPQALIGTVGTEGGGVFGGLAGARLGATLGSVFGPMGATGGAILGAVMGGQAGFRLGAKAADELSGLNEASRMKQQQQSYDPATSEVYMPPPPPTPQERMQNEILLSAQNPYMPYMMAQLGGYYA